MEPTIEPTSGHTPTPVRRRLRPILGGLAALSMGFGTFVAANAASADGSAEPVQSQSASAVVGATFVPIAPYRAFDSRSLPICSGDTGPFGPNQSVVIDVGTDQNDPCNVKLPEGVVAVTYNITAVNTVDRGFLSVAPVGSPTGSTSAVNWTETGQIVPNGGVIGLGEAFELPPCCIIVEMGPNGSTNFFIDITGYFIK